MSNTQDFYWSEEREPHFLRRKEILKSHPNVKKLFGIDKNLKFTTIALVLFQISVAPFIINLHWSLFLLFTYIVGATINHALFLCIHEITHDMAFKNRTLGNWLALIANIPIVFPFAMTFKTYHALHHWEQGSVKTDTDMPTATEASTFRGLLGKIIWASNQIIFYAIRPMMVHKIKWDKWHVINFIFQLVFMAIYLYLVGWTAVIYLVLSIFLAGSLHPIAGHFISEHYVFKEGQETYSYYGPLNKLALNVGYHNEHHDFPNIPGSRLPELYEMAPEYYKDLYIHKSWVKVIFQFITDKNITLFSRVKRDK